MHEYSIVEQYVEQILEQVNKENVADVKEIRFRRGSTFAEGPMRQAFEMLVQNTPLQNANLIIETFTEEYTCENCGKTQAVSADDLIGHIYICSECGYSKQINEASGLELLQVVV